MTNDEIEALEKRLRGQAYWMIGYEFGHEGENDAPSKAADAIAQLRAKVERLIRELSAAREVAVEHETNADEIDAERFVAWSDRDKMVAEVERLTRERDEWMERAGKWMNRAEAAERQVATLREALVAAFEEAAKILDARHAYYQQLALQCGLDTDSDYCHADQLAQDDAAAIRALAKEPPK